MRIKGVFGADKRYDFQIISLINENMNSINTLSVSIQ